MKDMTVGEFCRKFDACEEGRRWAYKLTPNKSKEMMSVIWEHLSFDNYLRWVITRDGVYSDKELRLFACRCVRETPLPDGRKVWDLLTDEISRYAVEVAERYANGNATDEELSAASDAAWYAASDAASDAASHAASDAASHAAWYAAWYAASDAARKEQKLFLRNPFLREES